MRMLFATILTFFAASNLMAKTEPTIQYQIQISEPHTHYARVTVEVNNYDGKSLSFKMPVWAPGSYLVREFEKSIENVQALADGKSVTPLHTDKNTWTLNTAGAKKIQFSYDLYAFEFSVRTSFIDASHAFLHNSSVFVLVDELKEKPGTVILNFPAAWQKVSTSLNAGANAHEFVFENYDELADSPIEIGNQEEYSFEVMGVPHTLVMVGLSNCDTKKFVLDLQKMCTVMANIIGEHPCKKYVLIVQNVESGGGGLEHKNSCCVMMNRWAWIDAEKYQSFLGLCAHEYFHLWNVKRIRPIELGPFNYNQENYTRQLWVAEGITSYYDELSLLRAGLIKKEAFVEVLEKYVNALENRPGSRVQSLAESSFDAWIKEYRPNENSKNTSISYYSKGLVVAALLDAKIIAETKGNKNLDDVMKLLYARYYKEKKRGFTEAEFIASAGEICGSNLQDFFNKHVYTTQEPDYALLLAPLGVEVKRDAVKKKELGITTALENGKTVIKNITRNSCSWNGGLNVNDELIAINGTRVNNDADMIIRNIGYPGIITAVVSRAGLVSEITFNYMPLETLNFNFSLPDNNPEYENLIAKWLGK